MACKTLLDYFILKTDLEIMLRGKGIDVFLIGSLVGFMACKTLLDYFIPKTDLEMMPRGKEIDVSSIGSLVGFMHVKPCWIILYQRQIWR